jgi:hypothetical protein
MLNINQAFKHFGMYFISVLDFKGTEIAFSIKQRIEKLLEIAEEASGDLDWIYAAKI